MRNVRTYTVVPALPERLSALRDIANNVWWSWTQPARQLFIDVGRVIWAQDSLAHAAREAARYASVHGGWPLTSCPTGPNLGITPATGCPTWTPDSKEPTRIQARGFATAAGASVTVTVCYFTTTPCSGDTDEANASNGRGEYVTVGVTSQVNLVTGSFLHLGNYTVSSTSTVVVIN